MSSSEPFPNLGQTVLPGSMPDVSGMSSSDWYTSATYAYNEPYLTPFPTTTVQSQPWPQYARASIPDVSGQHYSMLQLQYPPTLPSQRDPSRPRSSPSTFGLADQITWPPSSGLGIYPHLGGQPTPPVTSTFPPTVFSTYGPDETYPASTPPEIRQPVPKRPIQALAPNPEQVAAQKRKREQEDQQQQESLVASAKKRKRTSSVASADLSEDDRFLVQLKEDESLPWKDIANRFQADKGKSFQVAALQMRYKRLREKFRVWMDEDIRALRQAHEYWEKYKWEIIAQRMLDHGISERWPPRHCARKWQDLETAAASMVSSTSMAAALPHHSSPAPADIQHHFTFMPMQ